MNSNLIIRRATVEDAQLLSELSSSTFSETFSETCTDEDMQGFTKAFFNYNQIHKELENENDFYFVAFLNDKAVGYVRLKEEQSEVAEIKRFNNIELKRIYVLKEYHSQKIGAHLMNFALRFATERGYKILWLGVWEHNEKARAFYKKFGFEDTGHTHDFPIGNTPQTDSWFMKFLE